MKLQYLLLALFVVAVQCQDGSLDDQTPEEVDDSPDLDDDIPKTPIPEVHETEDEFEKEKHQISGPGAKKQNADALHESEDSVNEQNKLYNEGKGSFTEQLNEMSNMPIDQFKKQKEGLVLPPKKDDFVGNRIKGIFMPSEEVKNDPINRAKLDEEYAALDRTAVPDTYDASILGIVTKAKNQRNCGACAAFAATSLHETCMVKAGANKNDTDLSEQYLLDCGYNNDTMNGCNGAQPHAYTEFFQQKGGNSPHEANDLYLDRNPRLKCPKNLKFWKSGAIVSKQFYDYECNADKLKKLVYKYGGVMAGIYASDRAFSNYKSGIFNKCNKTEQDHAVLVTGYGKDNATGKDYWIIKNSWGESWGQQGFMKIERGSNLCGLESICVVAECSAKGSAETPPTTPAPQAPPEKAECDLSKFYNDPNINGEFKLTNEGPDGKLITADVKCKKSKCRPQYPGARNACIYICGTDPCTNEV